MLLTVTYADGTEDAYSVHPNTRIREARLDDFFYFSVEGGQVAINAVTIERIVLGNVELSLEEEHKREET